MTKTLSSSIVILLATLSFSACGGGSSQSGTSTYADDGYTKETTPIVVTDAINAEKSTLSQALKDSITYMYNEEKLAKDVYLNIYALQPLRQLYNIASKSEVKHEEAVNDLAIKYDLNITLYPDTEVPYDEASLNLYGSGQFPVVKIQELYDMLYDKGIQSQQDALEVGCLVEVTDIDDLDIHITQATDSNASDVLAVFDFLRDGSYKHYWAFDKGLKSMGITEGCCSLGTEYCHPEYPQN
ncbi:DUF2202 domain-containing protein [bacterium]|nr:DUF2202 domain-containing protein [bacterium]MBU1958164.1 DUF2202 domain-containing protein [bacterium]